MIILGLGPGSLQRHLAQKNTDQTNAFPRRTTFNRRKKLKPYREVLSPTDGEREVMELVVSGLLNKQVAARLGLSEVTVKVRRGSLMRKMNADSLATLVKMSEKLKEADR